MGNESSSSREIPNCDAECLRNQEKIKAYEDWIEKKEQCQNDVELSKCQPLGEWNAKKKYYEIVLGKNTPDYTRWLINTNNNIINQYKELRNINYFPLENYQKTLTLMVYYQQQTKELFKEKVNVLSSTIKKLKYYISDFELSTSKWTRKSQYHLENYKKKLDLSEKFKKIIITLSFICFILIIIYSGFLNNRKN